MSYIVQADLSEQISEAQLIQLTDDSKSGVVDVDVVSKALADAEALIDGYVAVRYSLPIVPTPPLLKKFAIDITIYNLYRRRQRTPEDVRRAYEDDLKMLQAIAAGSMVLEQASAPAATTQKGETFGPERVFSRDKMGNF